MEKIVFNPHEFSLNESLDKPPSLSEEAAELTEDEIKGFDFTGLDQIKCFYRTGMKPEEAHGALKIYYDKVRRKAERQAKGEYEDLALPLEIGYQFVEATDSLGWVLQVMERKGSQANLPAELSNIFPGWTFDEIAELYRGMRWIQTGWENGAGEV